MDYRMYDKGAPAGKNVVELIAQHLREQGQVKTGKLILDFVGLNLITVTQAFILLLSVLFYFS